MVFGTSIFLLFFGKIISKSSKLLCVCEVKMKNDFSNVKGKVFMKYTVRNKDVWRNYYKSPQTFKLAIEKHNVPEYRSSRPIEPKRPTFSKCDF